MRKLSPSLGLAVLTAAIWSSEQTVPAAIFPPQGDDTMSSMGVFRVLVAPAFRPLLAPNVGFSGYPGYRSADGRLTSPALLDSATTVGRSAPHNRPLVGSLPVGLPSMGNVGYGDYPTIPTLFAAPAAPAGTREILTQIRSFKLMSSREKCPPDPRVPTVPIDWPMVKAGPDQGVVLQSIGMVQENAANGAPDPDFPARSFFDIFVEVSLPSVPGTVSSTAFPALGAALYNDSPLIIINTNLNSLPPTVVYIHGETTAVPLKFKNNNPPYWNAGDVFGYLVLAGHGTQADCSSESAFLDAVLGPIGTSRPELPIEWPFPSPRCPPTSASYNSVRDVDVVNFGPSLLVRNFVHTNLINPILPPPLDGSATYNSPNTLVTLEASSDGGNTWSPAQANGQVVVGLTHTSDSGNTAFFNTEMFQLNLNGSGPLGPFMIRESPTLPSQGKHTIRTNPPDYFVSGFFDVFLELSINGGQTWVPANRPIRVQLTPPTTNPGIPIAVNCSPDITVTATGPGGAVVTFSSSASGGCKPPVVNCNPPSGSTFPIGTTTVTCTGSDTCGNTATCSFKVTVRPPPVDVEVDYFSNTTAQVTFQKPDGTTETVNLHGPTEVHVMIAPDGTGPAVADSDGDGLEQVPTEMVSMNLSGDSSMGPVTVNLRPGVATTGQIEETANSNAGRLDVDPFTPGGTATSTFDVNLEVHLGALTLHPAESVRMQALIRHKPPGPGDSYTNVFLTPVTLLDANGNPTQFKILREVHTPRPVEVDYFPNTTAQVTLQKPDGTTETVNLHGPTEVHVMIGPDGTGPAVADSDADGLEQVPTEMVLMNLSGNSSMGPVTVNLTPGVTTRGQIEETANSNPGRLDVAPFTPGGTATSIFDVNLEVHLGLQTLHPAESVRMQALIRHKPPGPGDSYTNVFLTPVTLLDANGNPTQFKILREVHTPRPVEVDYFPNTTAEVTLQKPDGSTETVNLHGPTEVHVMIGPDGTGPAVADSDADGLEQVPTEMVLMNLSGNSSMGPVTVNLRPGVATTGQIEETANSNPGRLDVAPFTPGGTATSIFDVNLEVHLGLQTLHPAEPVRMQALIRHKPPGPGDSYTNVFLTPVTLLDANGNPTQFKILREVHTPRPVEVDYFPNTTAEVTLQKPDGSTETVNLHGPTEVHVLIAPDGTGPEVADSDADGLEQVPTEMVLMNLSGNSSMGPVTVNLRPGVATTGQIEETANSNPGRLDVDPFTPGGTATSTFDVNLEVHLGLQTLHPAGPVRMQALIRHKPPGPGDNYTNVFLAPVTLLDANGNPTQFKILREVHTPRPVEVDYFPNTTAQVTLQKPDGSLETVNLTGPTEVHVMIAPDGTGPAVADSDGDGLEQVPTEMVLLSLTGNSSLGPVTVSLNPNVPTVGQIEETANPNPGRVDVDPFTPNGTAISTFEVYLQLRVGAQTLHNTQAIHMESLIHHKPPRPGDRYVNPFTTPIPLLDANGNVTGFTLRAEVHTPNPPVEVEVDYFSNTTAQVTLQKLDGSLETVNLSGPTEVHVMIAPDGTGPAVADSDSDGLEQVPTEMVLMNLSGNSSQGPLTVNLNPSLPTVGQIEETANSHPGRLDVDPFTPDGTAVSTFEVYLEVHVAGQTLHNTQAIHMETLIHHKPPRPGERYVNPFTTPIPLLDANGNVTGFTLRAEVHTPNPTNLPPILLACSTGLTVTAASASGAVVSYTSPAGGGCPPVNVVCNPPSGSTFPIGATTVICTASDACGQSATCSFTVTVNPPQQINLACSSNITVTASGAAGRVVTYTSSATSGCPQVNVVCNPPSGSPFPIGTTTVNCTASDACGNTAACSFTVTVIRPPVAIRVIGNQLQVIWFEGKLQEADKLEGPYIDIDPQPTSPFTIPPIGTKKFFRVRVGEPGFTFYDTEMMQLDISGGGLPPGMMIRESPTLASMGKTAISPAPGGGFVIDSFFDVFTELSMNGGQSWQGSTGAPPRMKFTGSAPSNTLPPREANYVSPADWHALYAQGIYITNASHSVFTGSFPPPPPGGVSDTHSFGSTVNMLVRPCPTCPYQPVSAPAQVTVKVTSRP